MQTSQLGYQDIYYIPVYIFYTLEMSTTSLSRPKEQSFALLSWGN